MPVDKTMRHDKFEVHLLLKVAKPDVLKSIASSLLVHRVPRIFFE